MDKEQISNYYVFYKNIGCNMYERTCGTKESAERRVSELKTIYDDSEYFENEIPKGFKWFY